MASQLSPPVFQPNSVRRNFCVEELGYARTEWVGVKHSEMYYSYIAPPKPFVEKLHADQEALALSLHGL